MTAGGKEEILAKIWRLKEGLGAWIEDRERPLLAGILGLGGLILLVHALSAPFEDAGPDGLAYEGLGAAAAGSESILACGNFSHLYWAPAWVSTIAVLYKVFGPEPAAIRAFLVLTAIATAALVARAARSLAGPRAAVLAPFLYLFSQLVFRYTRYYQYEVVLALAVLALGVLLPRGRVGHAGAPPDPEERFGTRLSSGDLVRVFVLGIVLSLAALLSSRVFVFLPLLILCLWLRGGLRFTRIAFLVLAGGTFLVLVPWTARNYSCFGEWIPTTTNGGVNLYVGNNPYSSWGYSFPPADLRPDHPVHDSGAWTTEALTYMISHPGQTLVRFLVKGFRFWNPHYGDQALALILFILGWVRFFRERPNTRDPLLTYVLIAPLLLTLVHMIFYVQARYFLPVLPLASIVAAAGLWGWRTPEKTATAGVVAPSRSSNDGSGGRVR